MARKGGTGYYTVSCCRNWMQLFQKLEGGERIRSNIVNICLQFYEG
jgi:hypothetical protein